MNELGAGQQGVTASAIGQLDHLQRRVLILALSMWALGMAKGALLISTAGNATYFWLIDAGYFVGLTLLALALTVRGGIGLSTIFAEPVGRIEWVEAVTPRVKGLLLALVLGGVVYLVLRFVSPKLGWLQEIMKPQFLYTSVIEASAWPRATATYFAITAAFTEELVYRWMLGKALLDRPGGGMQYLALTTVLFGLVHWPAGVAAVMLTGVVGLGLGLVFMKTRLLWPVMAAHLVTDVLVFVRF